MDLVKSQFRQVIVLGYPFVCLKFVWRQSEFAVFGALTSVGALFLLVAPKKGEIMKYFCEKLLSIIMAVAIICCFTACATAKEKDALLKAKNFVNNLAISKQRVIEGLKQLEYSDKEIHYAIKKCGANWYQEAAEAARNAYNMDPAFYSNKDNLIALLQTAGFTYEEAVYGANCI